MRAADDDGNPNTTGDPNWTPLAVTALDPSYVGAHAEIGQSAATTLRDFFGTDRLDFSLTNPNVPGVVRSFRAINADRFSLSKADQLAGLVGPVPQRATRWTHTFRALGLLIDLGRRATRRSDLQNAVDALRLLDENREVFVAAGMYPPPLPAGETAWQAFLEWSVGHARAVSGI